MSSVPRSRSFTGTIAGRPAVVDDSSAVNTQPYELFLKAGLFDLEVDAAFPFVMRGLGDLRMGRWGSDERPYSKLHLDTMETWARAYLNTRLNGQYSDDVPFIVVKTMDRFFDMAMDALDCTLSSACDSAREMGHDTLDLSDFNDGINFRIEDEYPLNRSFGYELKRFPIDGGDQSACFRCGQAIRGLTTRTSTIPAVAQNSPIPGSNFDSVAAPTGQSSTSMEPSPLQEGTGSRVKPKAATIRLPRPTKPLKSYTDNGMPLYWTPVTCVDPAETTGEVVSDPKTNVLQPSGSLNPELVSTNSRKTGLRPRKRKKVACEEENAP